MNRLPSPARNLEAAGFAQKKVSEHAYPMDLWVAHGLPWRNLAMLRATTTLPRARNGGC